MLFSFYGVRVSVQAALAGILEDLEHDFGYFLLPEMAEDESADLVISAFPKSVCPDFGMALVRSKRSTVYRSRQSERRVCFFEKAWVRYQYAAGKASVYSDDFSACYETIYYLILSFIGEKLDERGLHRLHGMGFILNGKGCVLLAPSGGGKSTLALNLLSRADFRLLSDDTPLVTKVGKMYAFPQRIALKENPVIDPTFVRVFHRNRHGSKFVIGSQYFSEKIVKEAPIQSFIVFKSQTGPRDQALLAWSLLKWLVLGYETPQIWELYLRFSPQGMIEKGRIFLSRCFTAYRLWKTIPLVCVERSLEPVKTSSSLVWELTKSGPALCMEG